MPRSLVLLLVVTACASGGDGKLEGEAGDADRADTDDAAADLLVGDADSLAIDAIPDLDPAPYGSDHVELVGEAAFATDRLVLAVTPEATVGALNTLLGDIDASILGGAPHGGILVVGVPAGTAAEAERVAADVDGVAAALVDASSAPERLGTAHDSGDRAGDFGCPTSRQRWRWDDASIGRTSDGQWDTRDWNGSNWGLKFARVPLAWSLRDHMSRVGRPPTLGIVDQGFHPHADVTELEADGESGYHGLAVTSVAVAGFTDRQGIEGVFPRGRDLENTVLISSLSEEAGPFAWASRRLVHSARMIGQGARVVNASQGWSSSYRLEPELADRFKASVARESAAWAGVVRGLGHFGITEFLVTCSAGNAGPWYPAEWNSGCGHRAAGGDPHFMSVEALAAPGRTLATLSGSGGSASAPGECVGVDHHDSTTAWVSGSGTSYAAPFVAGTAAMVWAADPDLTHDQVRAALLSSAHPPVTDVAPRIDAFAALLYIDTIRGNQAIQTALADIDDGSPDGNLRVAPEGSDLDASGPADGLRGDGCVDIKDLRVLRDAILDSRAGDASDALDGLANHTNRDLNGDGKVLPGDAADVPDDADREQVWARYDLNGDLVVDEADVRVMAEVWGATDPDRCPVADTRGIDASALTQWLQSADAWVRIPDGTSPLVRVEGAEPVRPAADDLHGGWSLSTSLLACEGERERDTCLHHDDAVACDTRSLRPGDDAHISDLTEVTSADGLVFLSRDSDLYTTPLRIFAGTGGTWGDGVPLPDSENVHWSAGLAVALSADGDDLVYAGCPGEGLEQQRAATCLSRVDVQSGGQTAVTPDATLSDWRILDRDDGMLLLGARDAVEDRWFVIDESSWSFTEAEVLVDQWSGYGPRLHTPGAVLNFGGIDGDTDSNGIHVATTHPVLDWDADAEAAICLDYGDRQATDVFRAYPPTGHPVSADGLVVTRPNGTAAPGTTVTDLSGDRSLELDPMTADDVAWSPDGRSVAISAWGEGTVVAILGDGDAWDDESLAVIDAIPDIAGTLRWSPDGTRLMIVDDASLIYGEADVWVYDAAVGDLDVLEHAHEVAAGTPTWSPDGGSIATASWFTDTLVCDGDSVDARHLDIVTESVTGGAPVRQTASFVAGSPAWPSCGPTYPTHEFQPLWR